MKYIENKFIDDNDKIVLEIDSSIIDDIECVFEHNRYVIKAYRKRKVKKEDREKFLQTFDISPSWLHRIIKVQNKKEGTRVHISHVVYHDDKLQRVGLSEKTNLVIDKIIKMLDKKRQNNTGGI
jgi:hypothetical protein